VSFYLVLVCLVAPVWSAVPTSWAFALYAFSSGRWNFSWRDRVFFLVALCEASRPPCSSTQAPQTDILSQVLFSIYHYYLALRISGASPSGSGELTEIEAAFKRMLKTGLANLPEDGGDEESERPGSPGEDIIQLQRDDPRAIDFRNTLRTWFFKAPWSSIKLHEVRQWLYWSIFNNDLPPLEVLPRSHRVILDEALNLLEKRAGCRIPEGSNPTMPPIRLTIDSVNITWRPLTFYIIICFINSCLRLWYKAKWNAHHGSYHRLE